MRRASGNGSTNLPDSFGYGVVNRGVGNVEAGGSSIDPEMGSTTGGGASGSYKRASTDECTLPKLLADPRNLIFVSNTSS